MAAFRSTALFALLAALLLVPQQALAQSILRDAETEAFFRDAARPIVLAAGMDPNHVEIVLLNDQSINAFVAGGQIIYMHSGLLTESDHVGQVQGVLAHELGHIDGGHIIRMNDGMSKAGGITIASLLLGIAAIAAGAGEAGMGLMALGQRAAMGQFLAFTRAQEASADQAGARYLGAAGISGQGSLEFFKKLQGQELRLSVPQDNSYNRTHPLTSERIAALETVYRANNAWGQPVDAALDARFQRIKAKLLGYVSPEAAFRKYPLSDRSVPAHYARAYAYHVSGYPDDALREAQALSLALPDDPYTLELKGQILLETGQVEDAIPALRRATRLAPNEPLIATTFGHALVAAEDAAYHDEAKALLKQAVSLDRQNPFAWLQLGTIYEAEGDTARAALASAERFHMLENHRYAYASAREAMAGIPENSADWLRAQDILLVSKTEIEREKGRD